LDKLFSFHEGLHRTGHTVHAFWAAHSVHHSSEYYNLSTAIRQSTFHSLFAWVYYMPLALFFDPSLFLLHGQFNLLYQFWIHTQCIGKLGPLEWFLNTPSQHRVHHGRNPKYIDKNFGGTLCIFDRLFGTFQEEEEMDPPIYGLTHALNTFDAIGANTLPYLNMIKTSYGLRGSWNKFCVLWRPPGWSPGVKIIKPPKVSLSTVQRYNPHLSKTFQLYLIIQFSVFLAIFVLIVEYPKSGPLYSFLSNELSVYLAYSTFVLGGLMDRKTWSLSLEIIRHLISVGLGIWGLHYLELSAQRERLIFSGLIAFASASIIFTFLSRKSVTMPLENNEIGMVLSISNGVLSPSTPHKTKVN